MLGGGAGHIFDMIARMKANQELRKRKSRFRKDYFNFDHEMSAHSNRPEYQEQPLTLARQESIKNQVRAEQKQEKLKLLILLLTSVAVFFLLLLLINWYWGL